MSPPVVSVPCTPGRREPARACRTKFAICRSSHSREGAVCPLAIAGVMFPKMAGVQYTDSTMRTVRCARNHAHLLPVPDDVEHLVLAASTGTEACTFGCVCHIRGASTRSLLPIVFPVARRSEALSYPQSPQSRRKGAPWVPCHYRCKLFGCDCLESHRAPPGLLGRLSWGAEPHGAQIGR